MRSNSTAHSHRSHGALLPSRANNFRVLDPKLDFDSGTQEPGETVRSRFAQAGNYLVFCGIHPKMELAVDVLR